MVTPTCGRNEGDGRPCVVLAGQAGHGKRHDDGRRPRGTTTPTLFTARWFQSSRSPTCAPECEGRDGERERWQHSDYGQDHRDAHQHDAKRDTSPAQMSNPSDFQEAIGPATQEHAPHPL